MEFHTFGPGLALDPLSMRGVPAMTVYLEDADTGDPVQAYTMDADPAETTIKTNRFGYFPQFQVSAEVRRLRIVVGEVELIHGAWELIFKAEANTEDAVATAQAAQAAAEHAASMIEAPADIKVAELIDTRGTATQRVLHGLYGARGNTFVQPTAPPLGITYEWESTTRGNTSVKKINGVEVARNLVNNPSFENNLTGWAPASVISPNVSVVETNGSIWGDHQGKALRVVVPADRTANNDVDMNIMDVAVGKFVAVSGLVAQSGDGGTFQFQYRIARAEGGWSYPASPITEVEDGKRFTAVERVPTTSDGGYMNLRVSFRDQTSTENIFYATQFMVAIADTEAEAMEQIRSYFDGDTPDDHANDVWFNTTDNREYIWDTETKEWQPRSAPGLDDAGIAALIEDTNSDTRGQLETAFGATAQNTITADALQAPGPVQDAFKQALRHYGAARAEGSPGARLVFGAIRNYGSSGGYWQPIDDSGHDPVGIASVTTTSDRITITTTPVDNGTIVGGTLIAVTDETLAKQGYFVGGSGGGGTTHLFLGRNRTVSDRIWWNGSGFEMEDGTHFTHTWSQGTLRLYPTEPMLGPHAASIDWHSTASSPYVTPAIAAQHPGEIAIQFFDVNGNRLGGSSMHGGCRLYIHINDSMDAGQVDPRKVEHASGNIWFMLAQTYR